MPLHWQHWICGISTAQISVYVEISPVSELWVKYPLQTYTHAICILLSPFSAPWYSSSFSASELSSPFQFALRSPSSPLLKKSISAWVRIWCSWRRAYKQSVYTLPLHASVQYNILVRIDTSSGFSSVSAWMLKNRVMNPLWGFLPRDISVTFNSAPAMGTRSNGWNIHPKKSSLSGVLQSNHSNITSD